MHTIPRTIPSSPTNWPPRRGYGLLEVVISVGCLVLLLAILLPWLLSARGTSRDKICLQRTKTIADAILAYTENAGKLFPYLVAEETGWPVAVSPFMELPGAVRDGNVVPEEELKALAVPQFVCPDDPRYPDETGALSYVVNGGYGLFPVESGTNAVTEKGIHAADIDLNSDGEVSDEERAINYATGVIWRPDPREGPEAFRMSLPYVMANDGANFTLLMTENLNAGNWLSEKTLDLAFVIGRNQMTFDGPESRGPLEIAAADLGPFAINANQGTLPGRCPAPSSLHGEYVHVMYCDGHGGPLAANIDPRAYAALFTSNGVHYGQGGVDPLPIPE